VHARSCYLDAVLSSSPAEFMSVRADVGGHAFTEVWRYGGKGPIIVYVRRLSAWSKLTCALQLENSDQRFDHTDCGESPLN